MWYRNFTAVLSKAGHAVAYLVETLQYKLKVVSSILIDVSGMRGRNGVNSACNRNEY
jgi:hypothetical protein